MKKGLSSNSSPKTFGFIFPQIGRTLYNYRAILVLRALSEGKSAKSLWKRGSGEEPFLRKVFPR